MVKDIFLWTVILLVFLFNYALADTTYVSGSVSGTWDSTGSPYIVTDTLIVEERAFLGIEPGCEVIFNGTFPFIVRNHGLFSAIGNETDSITFRPDCRISHWCGFDFLHAANPCEFTFCRFITAKAQTPGSSEDVNVCGGAIYCDSTQLVIKNCYFVNCFADYYGGAIFNRSGKINMESCYLTGNKAVYSGGAVYSTSYLSEGRVSLINCVVVDNEAESGGGFFFDFGSYKFVNCTITNNNANLGGGICYICASFTVIANTILWGNQAEDMNEIGNIPAYCGIQEIHVYYSDIDTSECATILTDFVRVDGLIDTTPLLIDSLKYKLHAESPCIDAGTHEVIIDTGFVFGDTIIDTVNYPADDIEGSSRPISEEYDIGAYEYNPGEGIEEIKLPGNLEISCYPNPFNSQCRIMLNGTSESRSQVLEIYDLKGRMVFSDELNKGIGSEPPSKQGKDAGLYTWTPEKPVTSGVYLVRIKLENNSVNKKIIYLK